MSKQNSWQSGWDWWKRPFDPCVHAHTYKRCFCALRHIYTLSYADRQTVRQTHTHTHTANSEVTSTTWTLRLRCTAQERNEKSGLRKFSQMQHMQVEYSVGPRNVMEKNGRVPLRLVARRLEIGRSQLGWPRRVNGTHGLRDWKNILQTIQKWIFNTNSCFQFEQKYMDTHVRQGQRMTFPLQWLKMPVQFDPETRALRACKIKWQWSQKSAEASLIAWTGLVTFFQVPISLSFHPKVSRSTGPLYETVLILLFFRFSLSNERILNRFRCMHSKDSKISQLRTIEDSLLR